MSTYKIVSVKKINKQAMAEPFSPEVSKDLAGRGIYSIPDVEEEFPVGGIKPHKAIMKGTGADVIFGENPPKMRKIYIPKNSNIVSVDGKEYFLMETEKSGAKKDGYFLLVGPVVRDANGKIDQKQTGYQPIKVSYNQYKDQIAQSPIELKAKVDLLNEFVDKYNGFVEKTQSKKFGTVTTLPLQLDWAERLLQERIVSIEAMLKNREEFAKSQKENLEKVKEVKKNLTEDVASGKTQTTPSNYVMSILEQAFHNVPTLEALRAKLSSLKMPFDPNTNVILQKYMTEVVDWQIQARKDKEANKKVEDTARANRIENTDLDEIREMVLEKVQRVETLPGKYQKSTGYYGPEFAEGSKHETDEGQNKDKDELTAILATLTRARQTIVDLPSKSNEYLAGEGAVRLSQIQAFMDAAKMFIRRYITDPFIREGEEVKINPKLFSATTSGLGNSLVAIVLRQIILSVQQELNRITGAEVMTEPAVEAPAQAPAKAPVGVPVAATKVKLTKTAAQELQDKISNAFLQTNNRRNTIR